MTYSPRHYQQRAIAEVEYRFRWSNNLLGVAATGGGKTDIGAWIASGLSTRHGMRVLILVHTKDLVNQWENRIYRQHQALMPLGVIQGERHWPRGKTIIATVQSLSRPGRLRDVWQRGQIGLVIVDETHRVLSPTYITLVRDIQRRNPHVKLLGLTATPNRTDGDPLGRVYDEVAFNIGINQLVNEGYLAPSYQVDIPIAANLDSVTFRGGDYEAAGVSSALNKPHINEQFFYEWQRLAGDRPTVIFTSTVRHARDVAELYRSRGVVAAHISGNTTSAEEAVWDENGIQSAFNKGKVQVVTNAYKWVEGVDIPRCSCIGWFRPTASTLVFQQGAGRGMRPFPNKADNLILRALPLSSKGLVGLDDIGYAANPLGEALPMPAPERALTQYEKDYRTKFEQLFGEEIAWRPLGPNRR